MRLITESNARTTYSLNLSCLSLRSLANSLKYGSSFSTCNLLSLP